MKIARSWTAPSSRSPTARPSCSPSRKRCGARLRAASHAACLARWHTKVGRDDVVLVDRPGRGYGDDYTPFLVDAPVGDLVRVRATAITEEGLVAVAA